mmetsp:Transcript_79208/g.183802  ORF Transcript_79208/g.183802 Transcript_79208/m.183802 type:complete len:111 (+) Transcript_79208:84-416(+)
MGPLLMQAAGFLVLMQGAAFADEHARAPTGSWEPMATHGPDSELEHDTCGGEETLVDRIATNMLQMEKNIEVKPVVVGKDGEAKVREQASEAPPVPRRADLPVHITPPPR